MINLDLPQSTWNFLWQILICRVEFEFAVVNFNLPC